MTYNVLTAILLAVSGASLGLRHIIMSPRNASWPCAPAAVRVAMFLFSGFLLWASVLFWRDPGSRPYAGSAASVVAVLSGVLALYLVAMLLNVLSQRRAPAVWRRINRIEEVALNSKPPTRHKAPLFHVELELASGTSRRRHNG